MDNKISVIVPIYNTEKYLVDCLESLINQSYTNIEIILVDDGSNDKSGTIADEYSQIDDRITVLHIKNGGVSNARNVGIGNATGNWISFVDSDDTVVPEYFECLIDLAIRNDADIAMGISNTMSEDGTIHECPHIDVIETVFDKKEAIMHLIKSDLFCPGINKLYRKRLWEKVSFSTEYRINEDYLANYLCFRASTCFVYTNRKMYNYRVRMNSASRSGYNIKMVDSVYINDFIQKDCLNMDRSIYRAAFARYIGVLISQYKGAIKYLDTEIQEDLRKRVCECFINSIMSFEVRIIEKIEILIIILFPSVLKRIVDQIE